MNVMTVLTAIHRDLESQGITLVGLGLGPCGDSTGDYDAWNMSVAILDWRQATTAVGAAVAILERYDLWGHVGVAVKGIACGIALEAK